MNAQTQRTPGPWVVELCGGHDGHRRGYYIYRMRDSNRTEWMKDAKRRIAIFNTEAQARAALAKVTP